MVLLVATCVEMISSVGLDKQLVQDREGDSQRFLNTAHALAAVRGVCGAAILVIAAVPVAWLFGVPHHAWAFATLGLYPLCIGLSHLDRKRLQRHMQFAPDMVVELIGQVVALVVAAVVAWYTRSFTAAIASILSGIVATMIASHLLAIRPYRWSWDRSLVVRMIRFGYPLLAGGILLFAVMHGERSLLASAPRLFSNSPYDAVDLGYFAAAGTLAYAPVVVLMRLGGTVSLPALSSARDSRELFFTRYSGVRAFVSLSGAAMAVGYALVGPTMLVLLYGDSYSPASTLLILMAIAQAIRIFRIAPTAAALALGDSQNTLWANVARTSGLCFATYALNQGLSLAWLGGAAVTAEFLALLVAHGLCRRSLSRMQDENDSLSVCASPTP